MALNTLFHRRQDLLPSLAIVISAVLWGLFWIPIRAIEHAGVNALWIGPVIFASGTLCFLPNAIWRWRNFYHGSKGLFLTGILSGLAFALYTVSFNLTDVIRAILLFYLTPLWGTILGIVILKERLTINRVLALIFSFIGLMIILGTEMQFPWPRQTGDWFALASGLCWSCACVKLYQDGVEQIFEKVFLFVFFAFVASIVLVLLPLGIERSAPNPDTLTAAWPWIVGVALVLIPVTFLTIWAPSQVTPGRAAMLYMGDIVVAVATAAILTNEPFGSREIIGTTFIIGAAVIEVIRRQEVPVKTVISKKVP